MRMQMAMGSAAVRTRLLLSRVVKGLVKRLDNFGLALSLAAISVGLTSIQQTVSRPFTYPTVIVAIVVASMYGGYATGLLCLALSSLGLVYFVIPPVHSWELSEIEAVRHLFFWFTSLFLIFFIGRSTRAEKKLRISLRAEEQARKEAEKNLIAYEHASRLFEITANNAPTIIWMAGTDKSAIWLNDRWYEFTGRTPEQDLGFGWSDLIHPDDTDRLTDLYNAAFDSHGVYKAEYRLRRYDGLWRWMEALAHPHYNKNQEFQGYVGTLYDITSRKQAEEHAERHAAVLEAVTGNIADALFMIDADGVVTYMNPAAEKMVGWQAEDLIGKRIHDELHFKHPDGTPYPFEECDLMQRVRDGVDSFRTTSHWIDRANNVIPVSMSVTVLKENGKVVGAVQSVQDISARVAHEARLREEKARRDAIFESALDAIVVMDEQGSVVEWNPAAERMFGWTKDEAVGQPVSDLIIPPSQRSHHILGLKAYKETGKGASLNRRREITGVRKDGTPVSVELVITPVEANGGMFTGYMRDITARKKFEEERENLLTNERRMRATAETMAHQIEMANREEVRLRAEAEQANRSKSDFLAMMSHELRTPLNAIGGYTQLLDMGLHGPVTGPQKGALTRINMNQERLLTLINGILDYAKLEAGQMAVAMETVALSDVAAAVEVSILPIATQKGVELVDELVTSGRDVLVRADPGKLQQILLNLMSNGVKFTNPGGRVRITCETTDTTASIRVNDTGRGIPAEKIASIFDPFVQVHSGKTEYARQDGTGTGLGLAISRDLARAMGGNITVHSEEGVGSSFCVELPLVNE